MKSFLAVTALECFPLDITDEDFIISLIPSLLNLHCPINAMINYACPRNKNYVRKLEDVTYSDFCNNVNMHLCEYFLIAQQLYKIVKK